MFICNVEERTRMGSEGFSPVENFEKKNRHAFSCILIHPFPEWGVKIYTFYNFIQVLYSLAVLMKIGGPHNFSKIFVP